MITFVRDEGDHIFGQSELAALLAAHRADAQPRRHLPPLETHILRCVFITTEVDGAVLHVQRIQNEVHLALDCYCGANTD